MRARGTTDEELFALVELPADERAARLAAVRERMVPLQSKLRVLQHELERLEIDEINLESAERLAALQVMLDERGAAWITESGKHLCAVWDDGRVWCSCGLRRETPGNVEARRAGAHWHVDSGLGSL